MEDVFSSSLELLYDTQPVAIVAEGSRLWKHEQTGIELASPKGSEVSDWTLHADAIWISSIFMADHLDMFSIDGRTPWRILELGAGAGLVGIAAAKRWNDAKVVISDYPDPAILKTISKNVRRNRLDDDRDRVEVIGHKWGDLADLEDGQYDAILAADTLWSGAEANEAQCRSIAHALSKEPSSRAHLVAGMHTGRHVLDHFVGELVPKYGLMVEQATEHHVKTGKRREWRVDGYEGEDIEERKRWLLYIRLCWQ